MTNTGFYYVIIIIISARNAFTRENRRGTRRARSVHKFHLQREIRKNVRRVFGTVGESRLFRSKNVGKCINHAVAQPAIFI